MTGLQIKSQKKAKIKSEKFLMDIDVYEFRRHKSLIFAKTL